VDSPQERTCSRFKVRLARSGSLDEDWFSQAAIDLSLDGDRIAELYRGGNLGPWQTAHVLPPLLRFLNTIENLCKQPIAWTLTGIVDSFEPITAPITLKSTIPWDSLVSAVKRAIRREKCFRFETKLQEGNLPIKHQMGWAFSFVPTDCSATHLTIEDLAQTLDPLAVDAVSLLSDLHLHTAWSDGSASVSTMASAVVARGLKFCAVTDHSRSSKLQSGLTPPAWLRQANALSLAKPVCPVLHGIEVDILRNGTLDLPHSILAATDIVVGSVHSNWSTDPRVNTDRLLRAIESGHVDILGHPTSGVIGRPGVPDYFRPPVEMFWDEIFAKCALWRVALEFNCFPSRLDLTPSLLAKAIDARCPISIGSDAHARSHLANLQFGEAVLHRLGNALVLNTLSYEDLGCWIAESRTLRKTLARTHVESVQAAFEFEGEDRSGRQPVIARVQPPQMIPFGSRVIGIDLTAGDKTTGVALLDGYCVETCSLSSDDELVAYVRSHQPRIVSIDSPLGLPGGGTSIDPAAGIVRVAEHDLASIGIPAYPALIDSMQNLTLRGMRLRVALQQLPNPPQVIESYPGAAQDILCIPRKQKSLDLLREGLQRLGLAGAGLQTRSHDEMDAITSAVVGRYFEVGLFEPMGIESEAQLIVPKIQPLAFNKNPVVCLSGKTGAGKSVVARYLAVFYGFKWIRTRDVIGNLLIKDLRRPIDSRLCALHIDSEFITEDNLREFGALVLDIHKQVPLRRKLTDEVRRSDMPIVVDSVRDIEDVDHAELEGRPMITWFIDCNDSTIKQRLAAKSKLGAKRIRVGSPVDRAAQNLRHLADAIIPNIASLEELRWRVDDALFEVLDLRS
jgi:histidinol phosphatase-like PHP family hydrolase/predicted nuclease with RNAse H fold/dephospho-CoA kinase